MRQNDHCQVLVQVYMFILQEVNGEAILDGIVAT
jgi:hypothetical protein